jgi:lipopolysaccharide transport system ATP-binding protein
MSEITIQVENLGKLYRIGERQRYKALRDTLADALYAPFRAAASMLNGRNGHGPAAFGRPSNPYIWALREVSFQIGQGEVVGIIGRNGAGKSTLLKILSRIVKPTEGHVRIHGRVGSLLEVGTGFHPELTGRENIYLNGAILGMKKKEIDRKFDEIVAFSEIEKFVDTPVKRYSSGMYVRLAFSVAAHLEPEILLVDEVLAVGDVAFQKKCLGKMGDVAKGGRTVLFVSHNMGAVEQLCSRAILIREGHLAYEGRTRDAVKEYLTFLSSTSAGALTADRERSGTGELRLVSARVLDESGDAVEHLVAGKPAAFEFCYEKIKEPSRARVIMTIFNHLGIAVTNFDMALNDEVVTNLGRSGKFVCLVPSLPLPLGQYRIAVVVVVHEHNADQVPNALTFEVVSSLFYKNSRTPPIDYCACLVRHEWRHEAAT